MGKINLAILDSDERYMENLAGFLTSHYRHRFNLSTFTSAETLMKHLGKANADILLFASDLYGDWLAKAESRLVLMLAGGAGQGAAQGATQGAGQCEALRDEAQRSPPPGAARGYNDIVRVDRYGGADKLITGILSIYAKNDLLPADTDGIGGRRENRIVAVLSAEGGCGRTSVSVALCTHYARLKLKALYLCLDLLGAGDFGFESQKDGGLSDIAYTIKARPDRLGLRLEALGKIAPGHGFFYYSPPVYPMDIDEIQPSDVETLIAKFRGAGLYDRVVIDAQSGLSLRNRALIELSDSVLIIASASASGLKKLLLFKEQIERSCQGQAADLFKRCHILVNRAHGAAPAQNGIAGYNADSGSSAAPTVDADEIASIFSAKVSTLKYCGEINDSYNPEALADISGAFGVAMAEIARRL